MANLELMSIKEARAYVRANSARIRESVKENLELPKISLWAQIVGSRLTYYSVLLAGVFAALFLISSTAFLFNISSGNNLILFLVWFFSGGAGLLVVIAFYFYRRKLIKRIGLGIKFDVVAIYKQFFTAHFDNLEIFAETTNSLASALANSRLPYGAPTNAAVNRVNPGVTGVINNFRFTTFWTDWSYRDRASKSHVYFLSGFFEGLNARFAKLDMQLVYPIAKSMFFNKKKTKLENRELERQIQLKSSDEVAMRRVLTPSMQSKLLERIQKKIPPTEVIVNSNFFILNRRDSHESFKVNFRLSINREKVIASYTKDLINDIAHFLAYISHATDYDALGRG